MAYDNTSFYGDIIYDEYDDKNNLVGTDTSSGFYIYHILGDGFDLMSSQAENFLNDMSLLSADPSSLDKFWGVSYDMPRPKLYEGTASERLLTDEEYRIYLYLRNCRLMTMQDIEINMNKCFSTDGYDVYFSNETSYLAGTSHLVYDATITDTSNLAKNSDDTTNDYLVNLESDDANVHKIEGNLSTVSEQLTVINIPYNEWDEGFLSFLEQFISVKGDLSIREYNL